MAVDVTHIVLDLDGTLIAHKGYVMQPRPHLALFLRWCFQEFRSVSLYTQSTVEWCTLAYDTVLQKHLPAGAAFRTVLATGSYGMKNFAPLIDKFDDMTDENTLLLDDQQSLARNAVVVPSYQYGDRGDGDLLKVMHVLRRGGMFRSK